MSLSPSTTERRPFTAKRSRSARLRLMVFWEALPIVVSVAAMVASLYLGG